MLNTITSCEKSLTVRATNVKFESSCHISTNEWLRIRREIIGSILGVLNLSYYATMKGGLSDV